MEAAGAPGLLKDVRLFRGLDGPALERVWASARRRRVGKGRVFFRQDEEAGAFYVLLAGRVKITQVTPGGDQVAVRLLAPGEMFGCHAAIGRGAYPGTAAAEEECTALSWDPEGTRRLLELHPRIALNALSVLGERLRELEARYRDLATERVERRVARALLRLARQGGRPVPGGIQIEPALSRQDLAEWAGTTLYTVSRLLNAWRKRGLVEVGRRRVVLRRPRGLEVLAAGG